MERPLRTMSLVGLLCVFASPASWTGGAGGQQPGVPSDLPNGALADLREQLDRNPIGPTEELRITPLIEDQHSSALLVQVRTALPPHFHRHTREILYLLQGEGIFRLESERMPLRTGSVVRVRPGQVHTFAPLGQTPAVFFVVTVPRWDEADRIAAADHPMAR
ncbi:MAG: cupin domain-containing protein [Nitrospiraceae bacterium]